MIPYYQYGVIENCREIPLLFNMYGEVREFQI